MTDKTWAWIGVVIAFLYTILPIDLIPDIPVVGWIDDVLIDLIAVLKLIATYLADITKLGGLVVKFAKWNIIVTIALSVILLVLIVVLCVKL